MYLERGPLSSCEGQWVATWKKSSGPGLENLDERPQGIRRADHATPLYPQKLALNFVVFVCFMDILRITLSSWIWWPHVVLIRTDVSVEHIASIVKVKVSRIYLTPDGEETLATVSPLYLFLVRREIRPHRQSFALKMEVICSCETPALTRSTPHRHIPEDERFTLLRPRKHQILRRNFLDALNVWYGALFFTNGTTTTIFVVMSIPQVPGCSPRGPGFDSRRYQIFWELMGLERGPLSLARMTEELLEWKSGGRADYATPLYPQKFSLSLY
jgi:hypothetical protein